MALSESFNKLMLKLSENMTKFPEKENHKETQQRPGSPFLLLLSEGDEEFNLDRKLESPPPDEMQMNSADDLFPVFESNLKHSSSGDVSAEVDGVTNFESSEEICDGYNSDDFTKENDMNLIDNETASMSKNELGFSVEEDVSVEVSDKQRSYRNHPMTQEEFAKLFDPCGRLVDEHELRRAIFKGGVIENIRKDVWQFLFELYPFNTTAREREILKVEQTVRYEAMKIRWKKLLKTLVNDYEGVSYCPKWYTACAKPKQLNKMSNYHVSNSNCITEDSPVVAEVIGTKLEAHVIFPMGENSNNNQNEKIVLPNKPLHTGLLHKENTSVGKSNLTSTHFSLSKNLCQNSTIIEPIRNKDCVKGPKFIESISKNNNTESNYGEGNNCSGVNSFPSEFKNDLIKNMTACEKVLPCDEIDNITEILAEAMLDIDSNVIDSHDYLDTANPEYEEVFQVLSNDDKYFPNPFTLPPKFINNQESLYSKSEQFASFDIMSYAISGNERDHRSTPSFLMDDNIKGSNCPSNHQICSGEKNIDSSICHNVKSSKYANNTTKKENDSYYMDCDSSRCDSSKADFKEAFLSDKEDKFRSNATFANNLNDVENSPGNNHSSQDVVTNLITHNTYLKCNNNLLPYNKDTQVESIVSYIDSGMTNAINNISDSVGNSSVMPRNCIKCFSSVNKLCIESGDSSCNNSGLDIKDSPESNHIQSAHKKLLLMDKEKNDLSTCECILVNQILHLNDPGNLTILNDAALITSKKVTEENKVDMDVESGVKTCQKCSASSDIIVGIVGSSKLSCIDTNAVGFAEGSWLHQHSDCDQFTSKIKSTNFDGNFDKYYHNLDTSEKREDGMSNDSKLGDRLYDSIHDKSSINISNSSVINSTASVKNTDMFLKSCNYQDNSNCIKNICLCKDPKNLDTQNNMKNNHRVNNNNEININEPMQDEIMNTTTENKHDHVVSGNDELEISYEYSDVVDIPVSLSSESLGKLPSWIIQVINASTPPRRKSKKQRNSSERTSSKYTCDEFLRAMDEDINKRKELMGIVENANKYLKEKANIGGGNSLTKSPDILVKLPDDLYNSNIKENHSIQVSKIVPYTSGNNMETSESVLHNSAEKSEILNSPFMTPISSGEVDLLINESPQFQLVTKNQHIDIDDIDIDDDERNSRNSKFRNCPYCNSNPEDSPKIILPSSLGEDQLKFMQIQAQVYAARQPYDSKMISESIRVIDKDVPRTDRELPMFSGDDNIGLVRLRDALLTYAFFNPDVGYAQGMNDIMARFLVVMDTESEAYWMFVHYMEHFKYHFMEEGMLQKVAFVEQLLMKMDRDLYDYLQTTDMGLMFCHRWLLLNFKREFEYKEAIRLFEITSSRHLEVSSLEAELERSKERAKDFVKDNAGSHLEEIYISPEFPFDIFVCVAMLMECRHMIMDTCDDLSAIYEILSNLPTTLDLQNILQKAEELFYQYCRKTVVDCFQVIDELEVQDFKRKKQNSFSFALK